MMIHQMDMVTAFLNGMLEEDQMIVAKLNSQMQIGPETWTADIQLQGIYLSCLGELLAGLAGNNQLSHSEAEYIALSKATQEAVW